MDRRRPESIEPILGGGPDIAFDILESRVTALLQGRPDNPITETGVLREFKGNAYRTRFGLHTGEAVVGTIGREDTMTTTQPSPTAAGRS